MANVVPWAVPMGAMVDVADTCGDGWWSILHGAVSGIPCSSCREHGEAYFSAMHDLVNWRLGKPLYDRENFVRVAHEYEVALEKLGRKERADRAEFNQPLARCNPWEARKVEDCIEQVKASGEKVNPWAVCSVSVGCSPWRKPLDAEEFEIDGEVVTVVEDTALAEELELMAA